MNEHAAADERRAIAKIYERDMDLVLVEELESNEEFRIWLAARVFGIDCFLSHVRATHSVVDESNRESDVVFRFLARPGSDNGEPTRSAILIENKIDAIAQPNQGRDYGKRGHAGMGGEWDEFRTCLVAPKAYLDAAHDRANFDESVSYEEILAFFASRKGRDERFRWKAQLVGDAIFKKKSGYVATISDAATAFVLAYYQQAQAFPRLQMPTPKPRPLGSTWISFRPDSLPKGTSIEHQVTAGAVKLMLPGVADRLDELNALLRPFLRTDMDIMQAGKSVAIAIRVPSIESLAVPFASVQEGAVAGLRVTGGAVRIRAGRCSGGAACCRCAGRSGRTGACCGIAVGLT
ncbi:MAG: hypothetical protein QM612_07160 [Thermomonas sp.]|uniref:hypothetical protein n=1 Tax=Thermomonas sp. TaxID=1971895 RepID=UPI0039E268D9